ncbi:MAG: acyl-ACP--UDP-N-acetylglucosamine O-acyltransferase [Opitutaceae bacterium]|nr:acyl-ACP--UDP-N-acetylglucosamine O-acyltransferase [Opitutaceae bacterium]
MSVTLHPQAIIEDGVTLEPGVTVMQGAMLRRGTQLGANVVVHPYAVIGGEPQDLRFSSATISGVRVGEGTTLREFVTINRSTKPESFTTVGRNCFLMAGVHLGHDSQVGDHVVLANNVLLAGHVQVADRAFIGGGCAIHQFCRVGEGAMIGGLARITVDVPPFSMVAERDELAGLNLVGLKRRGLPRESIRELKEVFRHVFFKSGNIRTIAAEALPRALAPEVKVFLEFFAGGKRGFSRPRRGGGDGDNAE